MVIPAKQLCKSGGLPYRTAAEGGRTAPVFRMETKWGRMMKLLEQRSVSLAVSRARLQRGWTQEECGLRADISRSHLTMIEAGRKLPNLTTICKLAYAFEMQPHQLVQLMEEVQAEQT